MLAKLRGFMATEVFKYLFFGILATLVYMVSRTLIFQLTKQGTLSAVLAMRLPLSLPFLQMTSLSLIRKRQVWPRALLSS